MSSLPPYNWEEDLQAASSIPYVGGGHEAYTGHSIPLAEGHLAAMKFAYQVGLVKGTTPGKQDVFTIMDYTAGVPLRFLFDGERTGPHPQEGTPTTYFGTVAEVKKKVQAQVLTITRTNNLDEDSLKRQILMNIVEGTAKVELSNFIESWESKPAEEIDLTGPGTLSTLDTTTTPTEVDIWEVVDSLDLGYLEAVAPRPNRTRKVIREGGEETKTQEPPATNRRTSPRGQQNSQRGASTAARGRKRKSPDGDNSSEQAEATTRPIVITQEIEEEIPQQEFILLEAEWQRKRAELQQEATQQLRVKYREEIHRGDFKESGGVIYKRIRRATSGSSSTPSMSMSSSAKKKDCTYQVICDYLTASYRELDDQAIRDLDKRIRDFPSWDGSVTPIARLASLKMLVLRLEKVQSIDAVKAKFSGADVFQLYKSGFTSDFESSLTSLMGDQMHVLHYPAVLEKIHRCLISISKMNPKFYQVIIDHVSARTRAIAGSPIPTSSHKAPVWGFSNPPLVPPSPTPSTDTQDSTMQALQDHLQRLESKMENHFSAIAGANSGSVKQARQQDKQVKESHSGGSKNDRRRFWIDKVLLQKKTLEAVSGRKDLIRKDVILCWRCNYFRPKTHLDTGCYVASAKAEVSADKSPYNSYPLTERAYQDLVKEEDINVRLFKSSHEGKTPKEVHTLNKKGAVNSRGGR